FLEPFKKHLTRKEEIIRRNLSKKTVEKIFECEVQYLQCAETNEVLYEHEWKSKCVSKLFTYYVCKVRKTNEFFKPQATKDEPNVLIATNVPKDLPIFLFNEWLFTALGDESQWKSTELKPRVFDNEDLNVKE